MSQSPATSIRPLFISISGLIGAGKTTLAEQLAQEFHLPIYYEPVLDNSYLTDFYRDMKKYGFAMQIHLLTRRFQQQQQILWSDKGGVQDRTIYEDGVFARMLHSKGCIDDRDYQTYQDLSRQMQHFMRAPDLVIHLELSPEESLRRVQERSRGCETGLTLEYLRDLHSEYQRFISEISKTVPVLKVDWNEFKSVEEVAARIKLEYSQLSMVKEVKW